MEKKMTFNVYCDKNNTEDLADKFLDLFIEAFMKSELDELYPQRNNSCPQSSKEEDESK